MAKKMRTEIPHFSPVKGGETRTDVLNRLTTKAFTIDDRMEIMEIQSSSAHIAFVADIKQRVRATDGLEPKCPSR